MRACRKLPVLLALIAFAGCGGDDEGRVEQSGGSTATSTSATSTEETVPKREDREAGSDGHGGY